MFEFDFEAEHSHNSYFNRSISVFHITICKIDIVPYVHISVVVIYEA